jgi:hypothetical protein
MTFFKNFPFTFSTEKIAGGGTTTERPRAGFPGGAYHGLPIESVSAVQPETSKAGAYVATPWRRLIV